MIRPPPRSTLFPYPPLFRSERLHQIRRERRLQQRRHRPVRLELPRQDRSVVGAVADYDPAEPLPQIGEDRKSTRLNSSHSQISYAVFCLKKKKNKTTMTSRA